VWNARKGQSDDVEFLCGALVLSFPPPLLVSSHSSHRVKVSDMSSMLYSDIRQHATSVCDRLSLVIPL
jgi:hypothetical protein